MFWPLLCSYFEVSNVETRNFERQTFDRTPNHLADKTDINSLELFCNGRPKPAFGASNIQGLEADRYTKALESSLESNKTKDNSKFELDV